MSDEFDRNYSRGVIIEQKLKAYLLSRGVAVVNVRHGGDVAPTLAVWDRTITLPDLQALLKRGLVWVEVKAKTTCAVFEKRGVLRTGIDAPKLAEYREVEAVTGRPVYVVFVHGEQQEIRYARASDEWDKGVGNGAGMVYRDWPDLPVFAPFDEVMETPAALPVKRDAPLFAPGAEHVQLALGGAAS